MKIQNYRQVKGITAAPGVTMRVVAGPAERAPTFVMRVFEIQSGSATPLHAHPWEHEVFVLGGKGVLRSGGKETPLAEGDAVIGAPQRAAQLPEHRQRHVPHDMRCPAGGRQNAGDAGNGLKQRNKE